MAEVFDLDATDANNITRWPENMAFSGVNDAGRADEGMLARHYEDHDGSRTAGGSSNAFTVTSSRTIAALFDNLTLVFTANHTITGAATLNLNGIGAKDIKRFNGNALATGDIVSGQPVWVIYKLAADDWFMVSAAAALTGQTFADFDENASPGTPAANAARVYAKDDSSTTLLAYKDSVGTERELMGRATQAQMETATDVRQGVSAGRQHFHPGHPKAAGRGGSGGGIEGTAYNVASITQNGTGDYTVTLTNAMADTNYWVTGSPLAAGVSFTATITSSSTFDVDIRNFNNTPQDQDFGFAVYGDMA